MVCFMLTDIVEVNTELLCCGMEARRYINEAYDIPKDSAKVVLDGVVSRKKQLIPALATVLQK